MLPALGLRKTRFFFVLYTIGKALSLLIYFLYLSSWIAGIVTLLLSCIQTSPMFGMFILDVVASLATQEKNICMQIIYVREIPAL